MAMNPKLSQIQKCYARWYPLIEHPVQRAMVNAINDGVRFPLVPAGRRSGKTERLKRLIAQLANMNPGEKYFLGAPTYDQVKKIFWNDMKLLTFAATHPKKPSEGKLIIHCPNETEIHLIGLDKPARFEGVNWTGGGIDEIADVKEDSINENIMPALDTVDPTRPGYLAWCYFTGVPDGLGHYYDMCNKADAGITKDAKVFHWKSSEILPPEVIEAAMARMSRRQFDQEYNASFLTASGKIYNDYSKLNHCDRLAHPEDELWWMHDQNFTPLSSAIAVREGSKMFIVDEIVLESAISTQSALEFVEKYRNHKNKRVVIYGDPSGRDGEKHGHESDYTQLEDVLKDNGWTFLRKVDTSHPSIKNRQNNVRAKICNAKGERSLFVNPATAPWCDKGFSTVQLKKGSAFQEDQSNQYQHITTAVGYCVSVEWPINEDIIITDIGVGR